MSGLFGALGAGGRSLPQGLGDAMMGALARPADAAGFVQRGSLLLGARARWLSEDEAGHRPPWQDPESGVLAALDGRLDHRERLAAELGVHPGSLRDTSDVGWVVRAYLRWGEGFVSRLRGDFTLALWDPRERRLLLSRDAFGVRPLYWAQLACGTVMFASRAAPLFAHPGLAEALDSLRIAQYLTSSFVDHERTFFEHVRRLAPGHFLVCRADDADPRIHRYFNFDPEAAHPPRSNAEYAEQFRGLFFEAVRVRCRTREPLGCLLSGGLDSSGLLGALRAQGQSVACFSARFVDLKEVDEGAWLELLDADGLQRAELRADRLGPLDDIDELHQALDEPFHAPNLFVYHALARLSHEHGTRVLLDGLDGDTVVDHGYRALRELLFTGRPRALVRALRALRQRMGFSYARMLGAFVFEPEQRSLHALLVRHGLLRPGYMARDFALASGFCRELADRAEGLLAGPRTLRPLHHRALTSPMISFYLEVYDKLAAAIGVEHRHPYFDVDLAAFCLALPARQRLSEGWDRVIQRRALLGHVPEPIRARQTKSVWTANFERQLFLRHRELIRSLIGSAESPLADYCDLVRLRRDLPRLESGQLGDRVMDLWCALSLGAWLQGRRAQPRAPALMRAPWAQRARGT